MGAILDQPPRQVPRLTQKQVVKLTTATWLQTAVNSSLMNSCT